MLPLAYHVGARRGRVSAGVRIGWPERRGSAVRREMHERRGRGVEAHVATAAGVVIMRACRAVRAWVESGRREGCRRRYRPNNTGRRGLHRLGTMRRQGRRGSCSPHGGRRLLCGAAVAAVRDMWVCAHVLVVGGARLAIVRRDASVVIIIRTREALQVRERVSLSVDTNGRRGWPAVVRRGRSSAVWWGSTRLLELIADRSCWARLWAKECAGPKDAVAPPRSGGRTVDVLYVPIDDGPEREVYRFVVFAHRRA